MIEQRVLSLQDARRVIDAVIAHAEQHDHDGIAVFVVDKAGDIIASARMDRRSARFGKAAHRKAYTGATFERDTAGVIKFWNEQEQRGHRGPHDWNDPMVTTLPGGMVVAFGDQVVGGIGVAGGNAHIGDEEFADVAFAALGEGFHHYIDWPQRVRRDTSGAPSDGQDRARS
ncbi:MAG TPA: heme-binding protein [Acidimicrobiales bacterium]|nr:heme-binding protein [Acidimicrobiales bacterium]